MKLHSPAFEKLLQRSVKEAVDDSPALKRERKRLGSSRRNVTTVWVGRLVFSIMLGVLTRLAAQITGHLVTGLAVINLWMLGSIWFQANGIRARLYNSADMAALSLLPIARERLFRWQFQKCIRYGLWTLADLLVGFGVLATLNDFSPAKWVATIFVAIVSWLVLVSLSLFHAARLNRSPMPMVSMLVALLVGAVVVGRQLVGPIILKFLDQAAPQLNVVLPTGWPVSMLRLLEPDPQWWTLILLLPVVVVVATLPDSVRRLFGRLAFRERVHEPAADLIPVPVSAVSRTVSGAPVPPHTPRQLGPTAIEELILSRAIFSPPAWPGFGWMERRLWRWCGPREHVLFEFIFPAGYSLTASWKTIFRNLAIAIAAAFLAGLVSINGRFCILGAGLFVTVCHVLALISNSGRTFRPASYSGVNIPFHAGFGLGFQELSRLLFKCAAIQFPLLLVFSLTAGLATALLAGYSIPWVLIFSFKAGILMYAIRLFMLAMAFSGLTSNAHQFSWRSLTMFFVNLLLGLAFLGLAGCGLLLSDQLTAWLLFIAALVDAYGFFRVYQWFYHNGRIDLMSVPRQG